MAEAEQINFDNNLILVNNQNVEEAEEEEERKRREEEMHDFLTHAMDDFNYDDQSTINSLAASDEEDNNVDSRKDQFQYANQEEQLKILYEVRVREVQSLNNELVNLKLQFNEQEKQLKKKATLLEIENERDKLSLKEARNLLVDKTEKIQRTEAELESTKLVVNNLEIKIAEFQDEMSILRQMNAELEQQLGLTERGFPLLNKTTDNELLEAQNIKIVQLEKVLQETIEQAEHREQQHKEIFQDLLHNLQEKEDLLVEKNAVVDKLTEDITVSQNQCQELLKTVDELNQLHKNTDNRRYNLEEELRKIRESNEQTDELCAKVKRIVSEEFQNQINTLNSENKQLKDTISIQKEEFKQIQQHLQILSGVETEKSELESTLKELKFNFNKINADKIELNHKLNTSEEQRNALNEECMKLQLHCQSLRSEKEVADKLKIKLLQLESRLNENGNKCKMEQCNQTSFLYEAVTENLQDQLSSAHNNINKLQTKIEELIKENSQLKVEIGLEQERDVLIKKLKEKAAEFEKIIFEKQKRLSENQLVSVNTNTDPYLVDNNSLLKVKYDTIIYQTEANLRKKVKAEFDEKFNKMCREFNNKLISPKCDECSNLKEENKNLNDLKEQDRQAVLNLINVWKAKFFEIEQNMLQLLSEKTRYDQQAAEMKQDYIEKCRQFGEYLQKITKDFEKGKNTLLQANMEQCGSFTYHLKKIQTKLYQGNEEIHAIEKRYEKNITSIKKS